MKNENLIHYEVEGRNGYYAVDEFRGDSCLRPVYSGKRKDAECVAAALNNAYKQGVCDATGEWPTTY